LLVDHWLTLSLSGSTNSSFADMYRGESVPDEYLGSLGHSLPTSTWVPSRAWSAKGWLMG
jgi:hypothetical protein